MINFLNKRELRVHVKRDDFHKMNSSLISIVRSFLFAYVEKLEKDTKGDYIICIRYPSKRIGRKIIKNFNKLNHGKIVLKRDLK